MTIKDVYAAYGITVRPAALDSALSALRDKDSEIARLQAQVDAFAEALRKVSVIGNEYGLSHDEYQQRLIAAAGYARVALSAVGR